MKKELDDKQLAQVSGGVRLKKPNNKKRKPAPGKKPAPGLPICPQCHEPMLPHRVCPNCGYYDGKDKDIEDIE